MTAQLVIEGVQPPPAQTTKSITEFRYKSRVVGFEELAREHDKALAAIENYQDEKRLLEFNIVEMRAALELIANDDQQPCDLRLCNHVACDFVRRYRMESRDALLRVGGTVHRG